jgi:putative transposase
VKTLVQSHTAYQLLYHIVWIPKYRRKLLVEGVDKYLEEVMRTYLLERYPDVVIEELSIQVDHLHTMLIIPTKYSVSKVVGDIKSNTSKELRKKFDYLRRVSKDGMWSTGYFVSSVGLDEQRIRRYIQYQEEQDKGQEVRL